MAASLLREISKDERERAIARSRRMYETDLISDLLTAEERGEIKGRAEGKAEGREEGKAEGVIKGREEERTRIMELLNQGLSLDEIKKRI